MAFFSGSNLNLRHPSLGRFLHECLTARGDLCVRLAAAGGGDGRKRVARVVVVRLGRLKVEQIAS